MFDFSMYNLAGLVQEREAAGERILLRDKNDKLVMLCNDGNYYCNVRVDFSIALTVVRLNCPWGHS